jgi:hypothetical protein
LWNPDTELWYRVTIEYDEDEGYGFTIDPDPVSAGTTGEWVLEDENGTKYRWAIRDDGSSLTIHNYGTTENDVTTVELEATNGTTKTVVVELESDGTPFLDIP